MNPILAELGKKVVDRWLTALLLPGLLYAGVLSCAALAGHRHALDPEHLAVALDDVVRRLQHRPVRVVLAATTLLLVASLTAVLARELAGLVQRGLTCGRPTRWVRFRAACAKHRDAPRAAYVQHKTSAVGDHFALLELRSRIQYGIDIELALRIESAMGERDHRARHAGTRAPRR